jgi:hypothetical protein
LLGYRTIIYMYSLSHTYFLPFLVPYQQADIQYWEETLEGELEGIKELVSISL